MKTQVESPLEGNRIISNFMGTLILHYDESWELLLSVVDTIKYDRKGLNIVVWNELSHKSNILYREIECAILNISKRQTFEKIVQLIKWYNSQTH